MAHKDRAGLLYPAAQLADPHGPFLAIFGASGPNADFRPSDSHERFRAAAAGRDHRDDAHESPRGLPNSRPGQTPATSLPVMCVRAQPRRRGRRGSEELDGSAGASLVAPVAPAWRIYGATQIGQG